MLNSLTKIHIRSIKLRLLKMPLRMKFKTSFGTTKHRYIILVEFVSDEHIGLGEVSLDPYPGYSYETFRSAVINIKYYFIKRIMKKPTFSKPFEIYQRLNIFRGNPIAKSILDYATWDLYAKYLSVPLYKIYGGTKTRVSVGVSIGIKPLKKLIETISKFISDGYRRIKIKIKPGYDIDVLKTIREYFPKIPLMVDANAGYDLARDLKTLEALDKFNLIMIEQPLQYDDLNDHAKLRRIIQTPICLDESITSSSMAHAAIALGSMDILNLKPSRVGGITPSLEILNIVRFHLIGVWIGGMLETGLGKTHLLHLATLPIINYPSDISASDRYWSEDIIVQPLSLNNDGTITVPSGPGVGVELNYDIIEKYQIKKWVFGKAYEPP